MQPLGRMQRTPHCITAPAASDMKLGITPKLFLVLLATNVIIAIAVGVSVQWSVNARFRNYLEEREDRRLAMLSNVVTNAYTQHGNWDFLRGNDALWDTLNRPAFPNGDPGPPREHGPPGRGPGPPGSSADHEHVADRDRGAFPPPPPTQGDPQQRFRSHPPLPSVVDVQGNWIVGDARAESSSRQRDINVDGKTVGWLIGDPGKSSPGGADLRFLEEQLKASWIISGVAVVLAAAVAWWLARRLLAPVKRLAGATHQLAAGDYSIRVAAGSRDELGQLVVDFNRLATTLESNEQMRRRFFADVSHELRTPLSILQGELEALEDGIRPLSRASLKSLQAEVATLSVLVRDLYDLSLADVGALTYRFEQVNLTELIQAALHAFGERFAVRRIALETDWAAGEPLLIEGDPDRLRQLLNNLLENSMRYTYPDGRLRVALKRVDATAQIDFQDSEPAVPPELLPRVFERLFRVEPSRSRGSGGAGLGLALCKSIIEAHHGEIRAKTSPLGGLWIEIMLPLEKT